jgi:AraC-like DNA-binding protein
MKAPSFKPIAEADAPGILAQLRMTPRQPVEVMSWTAPVDVLTFRCAPASKVWTRPQVGAASDFVLDSLLTFRPRFASWQTRSDGSPQMSVIARFERPLKYVAVDPRQGLGINDASMFAVMTMLLGEMREPGFSSAALVESIGNVLRIKLRRLMRSPVVDQPKAGRLGKRQIGLIREYIATQPGRSPSVTDLADLCQVSPRHLLRMFRDETGLSVSSFVAQVQLEKAKALLAGSTISIKQVAFEAGFTDPNHFSSAFGRRTGFTPSQFRALNKN